MTLGKVLIVEDEMALADAVEAALTRAGYEVCGIASTETAALDLARRTRPELAVIDVRLNPGNGRNVARELSQSGKMTILMATSEAPDRLDGIGASGLLRKPFNPADVPAALIATRALAGGMRRVELPGSMQRLWR